MGENVLQFLSTWFFDVERFLRNRLDELKDDLRNGDQQVIDRAAEEAKLILRWLPPSPGLSTQERLQSAWAVSQNQYLPDEAKKALISYYMNDSDRRPRGRPRDELSQLAIRALGIHMATGMSWRAMAMTLRGCTHERPKPVTQRPRRRNARLACEDCGEALRIAVYRLRKFLHRLGFKEDYLLRQELDEESRQELLRLWGL